MEIVQDIVTWLKYWFYDKNEVYTKSETYTKNEVDTALGNKLNSNLTTANKMLVTDNTGNVVLDDLPSFNAIEVVATLPTASASTMGRLYIINENSQVNVYYTENNNGTYTWHEMDTDILDDLSIDWSDVQNNPFANTTPSSFSSPSHIHGNITSDGKVGTNTYANKILVTGSGGVVTIASTISTLSILEAVAHTNIGTQASTTQAGINNAIDTVIGNLNTSKQDKGDCITSIELVPKSQDSSGAIKLYYGDEP